MRFVRFEQTGGTSTMVVLADYAGGEHRFRYFSRNTEELYEFVRMLTT